MSFYFVSLVMAAQVNTHFVLVEGGGGRETIGCDISGNSYNALLQHIQETLWLDHSSS